MKCKKTLSVILVLAIVISMMQSLVIFSSAAVNGTGSVEADWEQYLKKELPSDSKLQTYGESTTIYSDNGQLIPENERIKVYKIHTKLGNSASFIPLMLESRIEKSYKEVMNEEIDVTILSGYEPVWEKYCGIGDKQAASGKFLLQIQRGVDKCEVEVEIAVHKDLSLSAAGEEKWNNFLTSELWYASADFSSYIGLSRTLVTEENGVALPADQQYYTYKLYSSFASVELFTKEQMDYRLNWTMDFAGCGGGVIVDGYEEAYAKLSQMENGGSSTDTYKIRVGDYIAEIDIEIRVGANFGSGNSHWEDVLKKMPTDSTQQTYVEHATITHDENGKLDNPITVYKLHITLGSAQSLNAGNLESTISSLFYNYSAQIAPPRIQMLSGIEEALQRYEKIGDGDTVTNTYKFIYTPNTPRQNPSLYRKYELGVEGEIVIHKDLSIDEEARNNLSASWDNYLTTSLQNIADSNTDRTYGEDALIESVNNQLLPVKDRFHVYKIHTSFGRSASFTKESLEILLEESYAATMGGKVDIKVINGFDQAKNRFIGEGDHDSVTQLFTLQIKANGTGITKSVEIVIHKNIGLELCLPGELKALQTIEWTLYENPSFTREFVISAIKAKYWNMNKEKITVTVDDFESAFAAYRELEDGESMTCNIPVTVQKNNNSYSTSIPFKVTKDLSKCTGYNKGVCPNCGAMLGDVNEDGVIDENDALLMRQFLANIPSAMEAINMKLADINGDGTVNAKDQLQLRLMLAGNDIWA